jgi:hypothetical protein
MEELEYNLEIINTNKKTSNKGRKRDDIHKYFFKNDKINKFCCTIDNCEKKFSVSSSTTTLKNHINKNHQSILKNTIINNSIDNMNKKKLNIFTAYSRAFAKNSLPHSLIEDPYFMNLIAAIKENPDIDISKAQLRELIISDGNKIKQNIMDILRSSSQPVTLAIDGWTNIRSNKIINLLLISNGNIYYYDSIENKDKNNNKEFLVCMLTEKINVLINNCINLIAITTDNEILMKTTSKELIKKFPILIDIPCSAHIIQLCLKSICKLNIFKDIVDKIIEIINNFKNNKDYRLKLYNLQKDDNINEPLKIINPTIVRWSSIIISIERIIKLKKYISNIINLNDSFWDKLCIFHKFIEPIKNYTNQIQKNDSTLFTVSKCFENMIEFYTLNEKLIGKLNDDDKLKKKSNNKLDDEAESITKIIDIINENWYKFIDKDLMSTVKLFCFNSTIKPRKEQLNFIETWGATYLEKYKIVEETDIIIIKKNVSKQLNRLLVRQKEFSKIEEYMAEIKSNENENNNISYISKLTWGKLMTECYELSKIAIAILSICPSEACVERSFSILSDIHTNDRNRLHEDIIDAELSIKINLK